MTASRDPDRLIHAFLHEGLDELPDPVYDAVRDRIDQTRQRAVIGPWRTTDVNRYLKIALGAAAVVVIALVGFQFLGDSSSGGPGATETPEPTATPAPASSASATPGPVTEILTGGRYAFDAAELTIVATGPDGWRGYLSGAMFGPEPRLADAPDGIGIVFTSARGLFSDPCHWDVAGTGQSDQPGDVSVGPTVDDLVAALRANAFYTSSASASVTIDGYPGQELELQLPQEPDYATCDKDDPDDSGGHVFVFAGSGLYAQGQANRWHLYILDVEGTRLIAVVLSYAGTPQADLDTAQNVIDTMDIQP